MKFCASLVQLATVAFCCFGICGAAAVAQAKPLIIAPVDATKQIALKGSSHPIPNDAKDLGVADSSLAAGRMMILLARSPEQEADLQSFLRETHRSGSTQYHQWLPAGAFGKRFGIADADLQQVTRWLESQGLTAGKVLPGKAGLEFTGTVGQVSRAFNTSIHQYAIGTERHYANSVAPNIPQALAPAITGIAGLNDFSPKPQYKLLGQAIYDPKTHTGKPLWNYPDGNLPFYFLAPEDFATQYDVKPVYAAGLNGIGQTIGIINDSNIDISLVNAYRKLFSLPANPPQVVIDGSDPEVNDDSIEAYLDVENAGAVAPNATVKLYIGGSLGILRVDGLIFALARAVEDDAATSLSLSFGTCEEESTDMNQFINQMWEEAAAQGQTVFVSTGDSGSEGCTGGLGVNGFASTPWNVAVGGSDFYFSDYASGGASIGNYWNTTNDSALGSLQKPMVEQPWDGSVFGLNSTTYDPLSNQIDQDGDVLGLGAGGGGASDCAVSTTVVGQYYDTYTCVSGWPKPSWQVGIGVPNDRVRDLPDLSLFASSGYNGVTWPICALPGDCTVTDPINGGNLQVSGVGGTSASTPAMAGIMALINQKYGPQGQANYVLYPLAAQFPSIINPIDIGSNNEPCVTGQPDCTADTNDSYLSLQHYHAGPGYDQASGLGSIDVNALLTNWNKVTFKPSTTALTLSATSITHGQNVTATVDVTGTGTPNGGVTLVSTSPLDAYKSLASLDLGTTGTATTAINYLPGGTYSVSADYSGDTVNGASKSAPTSVTVLPESSTAQLVGYYIDQVTDLVDTLASGTTLPYGIGLDLDVTIVGAASPANGADGEATGTVTFLDGTTTLAVIPLNSSGVAEYSAGTLPLGSHSITATYAGDPSFKASTSGSPVTFKVGMAPSQVIVQYDLGNTTDPVTDNPVYAAGQSIVMSAIADPLVGDTGVVPTGTMTFQYGSNPAVTVPLSPQNLYFFGNGSQAAYSIANLQAGSYVLTATYSGDANYAPSTQTQAFEVTASKLATSTTTLALTSPSNAASITPSTYVTMTVTVTGNGTAAPTGTTNLNIINLFILNTQGTLVPGPGNTSTATFTFPVGTLISGDNPFVATYSGDSVYSPSTSGIITNIFDDPSDFSIVTQSANLTIASGSSGTAALSLASISGFNATLGLTCSAPASMTCSLNPAAIALNGSATATITVNTSVTATVAQLQPKPGSRAVDLATGSALACLVLIVLPMRRRSGKALLTLLICAALATAIGCGGKSSPVTPPQPVVTNTPSGTYTVVVTGTAPSGTIHNVAVTIVVQ